jgi:hypothetical protein
LAKESSFELLIPLARHIQDSIEFRVAVQTVEQRVSGKIRITEETRLNAGAQHAQSGGFISQHGIYLRDLICSFWVTHPPLPNLLLLLVQEDQAFCLTPMDRVAQSFADSRIQSGINLVGAVEVPGSLVEVLFVKFAKTTIKENKR